MALINTWYFTRTIIQWEKIEAATHNQYRVVTSRPYKGNEAKGLPAGLNVTLQVLVDDFDYGVDKLGIERENNVFATFDATILGYTGTVKKGDLVSLHDFDENNSFVLDYNMILRFHDMKVLQRGNAATQHAKQAGNA